MIFVAWITAVLEAIPLLNKIADGFKWIFNQSLKWYAKAKLKALRKLRRKVANLDEDSSPDDLTDIGNDVFK